MVKARKKKKEKIKELDHKASKKFFLVTGIITLLIILLIYFMYNG